jgi:hypothetical protein
LNFYARSTASKSNTTHTVTDDMHQRFYFLDVCRFYSVKTLFYIPALNIDAVEKEHVKVQQGTDCFNEAGFVDPVGD